MAHPIPAEAPAAAARAGLGAQPIPGAHGEHGQRARADFSLGLCPEKIRSADVRPNVVAPED